MARLLDQIIVIDIECTCWQGNPPPDEEGEIIEVGICTLDVASGRRWAKRSVLVRPTQSRVSAFCTRLTTLTQAQVDTGVARGRRIADQQVGGHRRSVGPSAAEGQPDP